ncbi:MAG: ATP-dependent Clp protease ATP-binding subunit ClpX [Myxococcota bacterium]|jgi:ATP-dependent Clp protease ATP-binding subunit ClpX
MIPQRVLTLQQYVERIPALTPVQVYERLTSLGYRGQDTARRAMALVAYRHVRRLHRLHVEGVPRGDVAPKPNTLMIGPTGCGKTYLVELLFQRILQLPTVVVDVTGFSETGYIGNDAVTVLTQLLNRAGDNPQFAATGIVCLDEFDKLASQSNQARFDGEGSTKDVSGLGVQKELLRMMEAGEMPVPLDNNNSAYSGKVTMRTDDVTFIACGAFSGFKSIASNRGGQSRVGFLSEPKAKQHESIAARYDESDLAQIENFQTYGFLPELMGRFSRIVPLTPLSRETLREILHDNVIHQFEREFEDEGLALDVSEAVVERVVDLALERQTGARGLTAIMTQMLEDAAFETFGTTSGTVAVTLNNGELAVDVTAKKPRRTKRKPAPSPAPAKAKSPKPK